MAGKKKTRKNRIHVGTADRVLYTVVDILMILLLVVILYPLIYVVSSSFSSGSAVTGGKVILWPVEFSLNGYRTVFSYKQVWVGYRNTLLYTFAGTALNLFLTTTAAYALSRKNFQGRSIYTTIFIITMFISGGMIPTYILVTKLHLTNTVWALIIMGGISTYNMVIMRTYFQNNIPGELFDSARIDGITDIGYLFHIVIPLSKAIFAVITLYYAVGHWNSYFDALLYTRKPELQPLALVLRDILNVSRIDLSQITDPELVAQMYGLQDLMKYALIVVSTVPILILYSFVQKFFEKGVMIGSIKG